MKRSQSNLVSHWRHVLSTNFAAFELTDEQADSLVLAQDKNERILDAAMLDLRAWNVLVQILDDLSLRPVYPVCQFTMANDRKRGGPGSRRRMALLMTCKMAVPLKKGAAPMVIPGMRIFTVTPSAPVRVEIYILKLQSNTCIISSMPSLP